MLNHRTGWTTVFSPPFLPTVFKHSSKPHPNPNCSPIISTFRALRLGYRQSDELGTVCCARRRVKYEEEGEEDEEYEYNKEIAMLELYTQSAPGEAVLVHALLDHEEVEVLIFKGFSSCLSHGTSPDPSRSVVPARAVIKSIDRIKGPFDPCNIEYLEKDLNWDSFKLESLTSAANHEKDTIGNHRSLYLFSLLLFSSRGLGNWSHGGGSQNLTKVTKKHR